MKKLFLPIIDNGMGLSRTSWATCLAAACLGPLRKYDVILQPLSYPYPDGAMNIASNDFLASDADEMVVIDTDVIFEPRHLAFLLEHEVPLVFGLYPKKEVGLTFPCEWLGEENPFSLTPFEAPPLVEVKRVARGFMRVHRSVFYTISNSCLNYTDAQTGKSFLQFWKNLPGGHSEDFNFCDLCRKHGIPVLVDQRIAAQHEGSAVYPIPGTF